MLEITTKLKRVRFLRGSYAVILFPINLVFFMFVKIGEFAYFLNQLLLELYYRLENYLANKLKWDDVAKKQYDKNKNKFKK